MSQDPAVFAITITDFSQLSRTSVGRVGLVGIVIVREVTIEQIVTESLQGLARMRVLVNGLSKDQLLWKPSPGSWSIAECLQHLNSTLNLYDKALRITFERERQNSPLAPSTFRVGFIASKMIAFMEPPYRMKSKAIEAIQPSPYLDPEAVIQEYATRREALLDFAKDAARVDMSSIRIKSPILQILKLSITESLLVLLSHDRRHLWQAENVRTNAAFPKSTAH